MATPDAVIADAIGATPEEASAAGLTTETTSSFGEKYANSKEAFGQALRRAVEFACNKLRTSEQKYERVLLNVKFAEETHQWFNSKKSDDGTPSDSCSTFDILYGPLKQGATSASDRDFTAWGKDALFFEIQKEIYKKYGFFLLNHSDFDHVGFCMRVYSRLPSKGIMPMQPHKQDLLARDIVKHAQKVYEASPATKDTDDAAEVGGDASSVKATTFHEPRTPIRGRPVREVPGAPTKPMVGGAASSAVSPAKATTYHEPRTPARGNPVRKVPGAPTKPMVGGAASSHGPMFHASMKPSLPTVLTTWGDVPWDTAVTMLTSLAPTVAPPKIDASSAQKKYVLTNVGILPDDSTEYHISM